MKWTIAVAGLILVCAASASAQRLDVKIIDRQDKEDAYDPESPFWFKNGTDHTPIPLFADSVKQFSYGPPPNGSEIRTRTAEIARYSSTFATPLLLA